MGRKRIHDNHIGSFEIPKTVSCKKCGDNIAVVIQNFKERVEKSGLTPEQFVDQFVCRSCIRASLPKSDTKELIQKKEEIKCDEPNDSKVDNEEDVEIPDSVDDLQPIKQCVVSQFTNVDEIGVTIDGKHFVLVCNMEKEGIPIKLMDKCSSVIMLNKNLVIKHQEDGKEIRLEGEKRFAIMDNFLKVPKYDIGNLKMHLAKIMNIFT